MKIPPLLTALLTGVFAAGNAAAQVEINITGASGFRDTAYHAIRGLFGANLVSQNPADAPNTPFQLKINWTGQLTHLFGNQTVTIRASYNNVVPGIQDLLLNRDVPFLASTTPGETNLAGPGFKSDLVFSSLFQMSTPYRSPALEDVVFGATALALVKSRSAPGGLLLAAGALQGAPFLYAPGDLILTFRQPGNASDFAVNLGQASNYTAIPAGTTIQVPALAGSQFALAFPSINGVSWSVAAANRPPADPAFPLQTLWVSAPRESAGIPSAAWLRKGTFVQGATGAQIAGIGANAASASSLQPAGPANTETGVVIPVSSEFALSPLLGDDGNYSGDFQGLVESVTPDDFDSDPSRISRLDLFELLPGTTAAGTLNTPGRFLGYFELKPDGTLVFANLPAAPTAPILSTITRSGDVTTISFATMAGARYTLRAVNGDGLDTPPTTWPAGASLTGDGSVQSLDDTNASAVRFHVVEVGVTPFQFGPTSR